MKHIVGMIAAGILSVSAAGMALAQDTTQDTTHATDSAAPAMEAPAAAPKEVVLENGTHVWVDGEGMAWVKNATGENVAAPDGDHKLADGTTLTVKGGHVTAGH